ncbi:MULTISPECIES: PAS domain-containing protein [unclassified Haloferax]|uniref:PAS domain-containing protein n=1 Tax=Haloferax sp. Atlit-48N TaxID=2077198 RepID=A0ACD5HTB6_9EURY|nr:MULTISPECIES: PAS domain-containing protein [unclassified Haloferax]MBC9987193.1 PAS domain-containing sensor histidine kinase [Haloferax sp. AS1]RDZ31533.1 transcriptional regulator [Haloferax sp. Atlit-48N]RDZ34864.1 transcriptional regulator [Haloferax sp. Atlit-24N]RLM35275.1 PAS domain-containing sensor histidine kinase [Haloferax sp. Atlit-109R]RLM43124.1 PAS domain-containing sensor histidine kinase [Haloferax sp. Atlit-105R]
MDDVSLIERGFEEFPATIALLDSRGDIVYTNRSWRAFADANDYAGDPDSTGVNYLAVCDAARETDEIAGVVADGIRAVLRGDRDLFTAEYPCHSPAVYRWFALRVVPIDTPRHGSFALVSHFDITDRRLAELQVNEKNEHLAALVSVLASELKAQLASATASVERLAAVDGDAAVTLSESLSRIDSLVEWGIAVAGQPSTLDLGAVEFRPHVAQARALASPDGADDASLRVVGDGSLSADTHLFGLFLVAVLTNCYERNASSGSSSSVVVGTTADGFYVDDDGPRPSPEELAAVTADSNQLLGVDYDATHLSTARRIADLHGWQFDVGDSELGGARFEVRGVDWN